MKEFLHGIIDLIDEAYAEAELRLETTETDEEFYRDVMQDLEDAGSIVSDCIARLNRS